MALMVVAHPDPTFTGRVAVEDVGLVFVGGFTGPTDVPAEVQAQLTAEGFTLNATPGANYGGRYILDTDLEDDDSEAMVRLRAAFDAGTAAVVHVDPSGSDTNNGLLASKPKATIGAALAALGSTRGVIQLAPGTTFAGITPFTLDWRLHRLEGNGAILDFSHLTDGAGPAITVTGSAASTPYDQRVLGALRGVRVRGPGASAVGIYGVEFESIVGAVSHLSAYDVTVHDFATGVRFGHNAYLLELFGWDVYNCTTGVDAPGPVTNAGEGIRFHGGAIFNNDLGVRANNSSGELVFLGTSFDYNVEHFYVDASRVELHGCHIEGHKTLHPTAPIVVTGDGGGFRMFGGWVVTGGAETPSSHDYFVTHTGTGLVLFDGVHMNNLNTATGWLASGTGPVQVRRTTSTSVTGNPHIVSAAANLAHDGGFEWDTILDNVFVSDDTAAITSRFSGANIALSTHAGQHQSGGRALRLSKAFGAGSASKAALAYPIEPGSLAGTELHYNKPDGQTGTVLITSRWATLRNNDAGVPVVAATGTAGAADRFGVTTINLTSSATGWVKRIDGLNRAPAWATHVVIEVEMDSFVGPGDFWLDEVYVTCM